MTQKDFTSWAKEKEQLQARTDSDKFFVNNGEIWYAKVGINIGSEMDGGREYRRPVVIIKKVGSVFRVLPMTTKGKDNNLFYHRIHSIIFKEPSHVILSQIKTIDKKRLLYPIGTLSKQELEQIKKHLQQYLS